MTNPKVTGTLIIEPQISSKLPYIGHSLTGKHKRRIEITHYVAHIAVGKAIFHGYEVSCYYDDDREVWVAELLMSEVNK